MEEKIKEVLETKVNPVLAEHYGGAILSKLEDNVAWVKLTGACCSCPSAQITIEDVVKQIVMEECKGLDDVRLDNSVSEDILDMARKILNKEA
ncbi:NifU family protein [Clostridium aminobutyricum]|uniref:NifU family protein n=1 Tax=Clostridium aminobutyricum TaxID=33953 RepID=A0A939D6V5_CLOAM|nr:NifU family protein [Clostridium aminobutyricum]MBN7772161.1 NifU family protein [Clostridium aminobutyricum]